MFSIPFQQSARYALEHIDDYTEEEGIAINRLLDMSTLADRYNPRNADPVKGYTERGTTQDYIEYLKAWISQGTAHPFTYIHALNAMLSGWFSYAEYDPLMNMDWHSQLNPNLIPESVTQRSGLSAKTGAAYQAFYNSLYSNPLFRILFTYGFYASLIPAFVLCTMLKKRIVKRKYWIALIPVLLSLILGCWLAPLSTYAEGRRYLYPLTYMAPLLLAWCVFAQKDTEETQNG